MLRVQIFVVVLVLVMSWAATALAAHEPSRSSGPGAPSWLSATCGALSTLQHGVAERWSSRPPAKTRGALLARLDADVNETKAVLAATGRELPQVPHGAAVAATLHGGALSLSKYLEQQRALARRADPHAAEEATTTALQARVKRLGAAFVHLELAYPSVALASAIDQTPNCALVHG
jgi:hypothetical protein